MAGGREFKDTYTIEALLTGDASRLKSAVDRAKKILKTLESDSGEIDIEGNSRPLESSIRNARIKIKALKKESGTINIDGDTTQFDSKVTESTKMIDILKNKASVIQMNAEGLERLKDFQTIKVKTIDLTGAKVSVSPDFDSKVAESKISRFKASLKSIPNRIRTWLHADIDKGSFNLIKQLGDTTDEFQRNMARMSRSIQSFATVLANQIGGLLLSMSTSIVPMIGGIVSAVMALGNAIGVVAGGLGGLIASFGVAGIAGGGWAGMMATVLARYSDEAFQATDASNRFTQSIDGIKSAWNGVVDANQSAIFITMSNALDGVTGALGKLKPMFSGVSDVMLAASKSFKDFLGNSPIAKSFFNMLNTTGVSLFETLLSAVGKFGAGTMQVFTLMQPLMKSVSAGFEAMSDRFLQWSQSVEAEQGFKKFTEYVKTNLPIIRSIFGDVFKGIINLFAAFGSNSEVIFSSLARMAQSFREWSQTIKDSDGFQKFIEFVQRNAPTIMSLIGSIIMTIVNLGIALAPLGEAVLNVADKFFKFTSELMKNNPIIGLIIGAVITLAGAALLLVPVIIQAIALFKNMIAPMLGVATEGKKGSMIMTLLRAAFIAVTGTVALVIAIIAGLVASFVLLWNSNEQFRTKVIEVWNAVKEHISNAITAIKAFIETVWGTLVEWWSVHNENIMKVVEVVWTAILAIIEGVMNTLVPIIQAAWEIIKGVVTVALNIILGIVGVVMAVLNGDWALAWQTVKDTAVKIWEAIKEALVNAWTILNTAYVEWLAKLKTQSAETWENIKIKAAEIWEAIKNKVIELVIGMVTSVVLKFIEWKEQISTVWNTIKEVAELIWNAIKARIIYFIVSLVVDAMVKFQEWKQRITETFNAIKTFIQTVWETIKSWIVNKITEIVTNAVTKFNNLKTNVTNIFNTIKSFLQNVWNTIKSWIVNKITEIVTNAVNKFNSLKAKVTSIFNAVKSFLTNVWNGIKSTISNAVENIRNKVSSGFEAVRNKVTSIMDRVKSAISNAWDSAKRTVSTAVDNIKQSVTRVFNSLGETVSTAMTKVKTAVSTGMENAKTAVTEKFAQFREAGSNIVGSIAEGISGAIGKVTGAISKVTSAIRDFLPFSPAKRGALQDIMKTNVAGSIAETINKQRKLPIKAMSRVASGVQKSINGINSTITPDVVGINEGISKAQARASAVMNHTVKAEVNSQPIQANINLNLGKRDYQTYVADISQAQNSESQLEERYGV